MFTTTILLAGVMCNFLLSMQNKIIMKEQVVMKIQIYDNGYDVKNQVIYLLKKYEEEKGRDDLSHTQLILLLYQNISRYLLQY